MKNKTCNNRDKKGMLIGDTTLRVIMSVLALLIILYLGYIVYAGVKGGQAEERAKTELNKILNQIDLVKNTKEIEATVDVYPSEGWFLRSDDVGEINDADCKKMKSCLCFCDGHKCEGLKSCDGFDFIVEVEGEYESVTSISGIGIPAVATDLKNTMEFKKAIAQLKVYEDNEIIKIKKVAE